MVEKPHARQEPTAEGSGGAAQRIWTRWSANLVPLNKEELDLFSLAQDKQVIKTGAGATAKGTFTTIFHEPVVSYSPIAATSARSATSSSWPAPPSTNTSIGREDGKTTLLIDGQAVGDIDNNTLVGARTGQAIARIVSTERDNYLPIEVGNREVGSR